MLYLRSARTQYLEYLSPESRLMSSFLWVGAALVAEKAREEEET